MSLTQKKTINIKIPEAFNDLFRNPLPRFLVYHSGRGTGKSENIGRALLIRAMSEKLLILNGREYQASIRDSVKSLYDELIALYDLGWFFKSTRDEITGINGSRLIFKGLKINPESVKSTQGIDIAWIEEGQSISKESLDLLIPTVRKPNSSIIISFNPLYESDPVYKEFVMNRFIRKDLICKKLTVDDNPFFPQVLRDEMEFCRRTDPEKYAFVWGGETLKISEAIVFSGRYKIEERQVPPGAEYRVGLDHGFSQDAAACVRYCKLPDNTLYIDKENYKVGVEINDLPAFVNKVTGSVRWPIIADSARPELNSFLRSKGFNVSASKKGKGSIEDGIAWLKNHNIVVHPSCKNLIFELANYSYKVDRKTGEIFPKLEDKHNHLCFSAETLIATPYGQKRIIDIKVGDLVTTLSGPKKVTEKACTGIKNTLRYAVEDSSVRCTPDHRVITDRGKISISELKQGDTITLLDGGYVCLENQFNIFKEKHTGCTTVRGIFQEVVKDCTELCGSFTKALYRRATISTTKTETLTITISQIWLACQKVVTCLNTPICITKKIKKKSWTTSIISGRLRKSGMRRKRVASGILKTVPLLGKTESLVKKLANNAAQSLRQKPIISRFVRTLVSPPPEGRQGSIMKQGNASYAGTSSQQTNIPRYPLVRKVVLQKKLTGTESRNEPVYNITVEDEHQYFANGLLVANCDALRYSCEKERLQSKVLISFA